MRKPLIGLTPQFDFEQQKLCMRQNYMEALSHAGALPVVLPLPDGTEDTSALASLCDGFLFTGGPDVHPSLFGEETLRFCGVIDERRDRFEIALLQEAMRLDKPIFGICRGIQLINVALGGSLYQDIPAQAPGEIAHSQNPPFTVAVHTVAIDRASPLYRITGKEKLTVNSMHHQAVRELAPTLKCGAKSQEGLVECVYRPESRYFLAVQWHPEYLWQKDKDEQNVIQSFVDAAKS